MSPEKIITGVKILFKCLVTMLFLVLIITAITTPYKGDLPYCPNTDSSSILFLFQKKKPADYDIRHPKHRKIEAETDIKGIDESMNKATNKAMDESIKQAVLEMNQAALDMKPIDSSSNETGR